MTNTPMVALVHGAACSIGRAVAAGLMRQHVRVILYDENSDVAAGSDEPVDVLPASVSNDELVAKATQVHGRLDYLFNCIAPSVATSAAYIFDYPQKLLKRSADACEAMLACQSKGAIVNQFFTGSLFAATPIEAPMLMSKGAITGLTRQLCIQFGKAGIRINTVQAGLVQLPESEGLVTAQTLARKPPVGRWGTPDEVAKFMLFLALRNGYMTGQVICFDGGLTAGVTGT